ncbi:flagellar basal body P-ring formation chaperone FlgA [Campylobacter sp. 19-13652]|uniref:flagellar basal body P-ring formation chaperone FlgA n=1 Tax=Campylobacter sp. 19-13652 TaxID=2840180 RepID=UPI001C84160C|nr:flagellar basal body P-ring formation chaperone FlgA [Campylobacter sp. 19-13652]
MQNDSAEQKIIGFSYAFKATMPALIATAPIASKSLINPLQTKSTRIDFDKFKPGTLTHFPNSKIIAKRAIKPSEILNYQFITNSSLVKKGSTLEGLITEDGVSLSIPVRALEGGNLGDIIKVENKEHKIFKASIISAKKAILQ